jgi:translation elongation factor EF-Tu-like GTPase
MGEFRLPVSSMFPVPGRGTVFQGWVEEGSVSVGERITVSSPGNAVWVEIAGIERSATRELVSTARANEDVAILVREFDLAEIDDGIWRQEHEITPLAVEITRPVMDKRWWQFWK